MNPLKTANTLIHHSNKVDLPYIFIPNISIIICHGIEVKSRAAVIINQPSIFQIPQRIYITHLIY